MSARFRLSELAAAAGGTVSGDGSIEITELTQSSGDVGPGTLFVAVPGTVHDGHEFLDQAFSAGAPAAVVTRPEALGGRPGIVVADARAALSTLAAHRFGNPAREMLVAAVTGTNGKTTTHWLLSHLLGSLGEGGCGRIGTLGIAGPGFPETVESLTTPDAYTIHQALRRMRDARCSAVVLEASSHALAQERIAAVSFDAGIFTNLTRDHLDYHGDMESYFDAKRRLARLVSENGKRTKALIVNVDDEYGRRFASSDDARAARIVGFGRAPGADVRIESFAQDFRGSEAVLRHAGRSFTIRSRFIGFHNAQNLAGVFGAAVALGYDPETAARALEQAPQVPGRLEAVPAGDIGVYVDFAHTPDGLRNVLSALRELVQNELWVIFGCGGDRDRGKRPEMGRIAAGLAHRVVITSDNPRTEDPGVIIDDILASGITPDLVEQDRARAIEATLTRARPGDVVLIAGKGHEDYQIIGTTKFPYSDVSEAVRVLNRMGRGAAGSE